MKILRIDEKSSHLPDVKDLWSINRKTLGLFPEGAFIDYASAGNIIIAIDPSKKLLGYLLFRISRGNAIIVHLCVSRNYQKRGVAKALVDHLIKETNYCLGTGLRCRRDYAAAKIWPKLGFVAKHDRPGRSKTGTALTYWWRDNGHPDLFTSTRQDDNNRLMVVIDANIFFDFEGPSTSQGEESLALRADWIADDIHICLTQEIYNEIDRKEDGRARLKARSAATKYYFPLCTNEDVETVLISIRDLFPDNLTESDESDTRQLARTIASESAIFITRDDDLLSLADELYKRHGLTVLRPSELVVRIDQLRRETVYRPARLAGTLLNIKLLDTIQADKLIPYFQGVTKGESKAYFLKKIRKYLSDPRRFLVNLIEDEDGNPLSLLVEDWSYEHQLVVPLVRLTKTATSSTLARHLIQKIILHAVKNNKVMCSVDDIYLDGNTESALPDFGFVKTIRGWSKLNIRFIGTTPNFSAFLLNDVLGKVSTDFPRTKIEWLLESSPNDNKNRSVSSLESCFWPLKIIDSGIPTFIVPIKPRWAKHLFDEGLAGQTLFGADKNLALRCENVYYKSIRNTGGLCAPGRILWYVSQEAGYAGTGQIRACSLIEKVEIGKPKILFKNYQRLGIYTWNDIFRLANSSIENNIMAIVFHATEAFDTPISWGTVQELLRKEGIKTQLQSPVKITESVFEALYKSGIGN